MENFEKPIFRLNDDETDKSKEEPIKGENFILKKSSSRPEFSYTPPENSLEFRQGESTEKKIERDKIAKEKELERVKDFTPTDYAEEFFADMLEHNNPYSETFLIKENGQFDREKRIDGSTPHMQEANTPEELYQIAKEIKERYPEYEFSFENDKHGKWIKYTVSKEMPEK